MKKYTQTGAFIIAIFAIILIVLPIGLFQFEKSPKAETVYFGFILLAVLVSLLFFYKLTITVDEKGISFKFGIGWFGKKYLFSEIASCKPVRNKWYYGIGIRYLGNGWLYNVSGLKAIELTFKNKKSVVRIGTDQPEEICEVFQKFTTDKLSTDH